MSKTTILKTLVPKRLKLILREWDSKSEDSVGYAYVARIWCTENKKYFNKSLLSKNENDAEREALLVFKQFKPTGNHKVYMILENSTWAGYTFKIGRTTNTENRLKNIQTSNPNPLVLYAESNGYSLKDAVNLEKQIQKRIKKFAEPLMGEWFTTDDEDILEIARACVCAGVP